jgi:hypothetical protein
MIVSRSISLLSSKSPKALFILCILLAWYSLSFWVSVYFLWWKGGRCCCLVVKGGTWMLTKPPIIGAESLYMDRSCFPGWTSQGQAFPWQLSLPAQLVCRAHIYFLPNSFYIFLLSLLSFSCLSNNSDSQPQMLLSFYIIFRSHMISLIIATRLDQNWPTDFHFLKAKLLNANKWHFNKLPGSCLCSSNLLSLRR